jgi:hypothetical protein
VRSSIRETVREEYWQKQQRTAVAAMGLHFLHSYIYLRILHSPSKIDKGNKQRTKLHERNFVKPIFTKDKAMFMLILLFDISIPPNS